MEGKIFKHYPDYITADPKIEDFEIICNNQVGSANVSFKSGGVEIGVDRALELLLLKAILEKLSK